MEEAATYGIKDSGARKEFPSGAKRDIHDDKPRPDFISPFFLLRLGEHLKKGAIKYGPYNWAKGIPNSSYWASAVRHMCQIARGDTDEDHLSAIAFNIMGIIHNQEAVKQGLLPKELLDWPINWNNIT